MLLSLVGRVSARPLNLPTNLKQKGLGAENNDLKGKKMNYQDVIKDSKFYLPMNLNLGYLLKDTEIMILMNVINCDIIHEKLSVRKLQAFTGRSNNTVQNALTRLRTLQLIEGFKPNYDRLKYVFDNVNNATSINERKNWCKVYQKTIQESVSKTDTKSVSKTDTQIKKIDKKDENKKDIKKPFNISCDVLNEEIEKFCSEENKPSNIEVMFAHLHLPSVKKL